MDMNIVYSKQLIDYMKLKNKKIILVELVEINTSDIEIAELHVQFADEAQKKRFMEKKSYYRLDAPWGELIMPPFPLECDEEVFFDLKKFLCFYFIKYNGMKVSIAF